MATLREVRNRIRSVESTAKITKAMELVAASKMRRAQERALAGRPYAERLNWVLADLAETIGQTDPETLHPLLRPREVRSVGIVLITPSRGLCGGLPTAMNRRTSALILEAGLPASMVAVGRKGRDFFRRSNVPIRADFTFDQAFIVYPYFVNTMTQEPRVLQILPVEPPQEQATTMVDYIYEPGREELLADLLPRYIEMQIYEAVLEGIASEQSARMVAMRNATDAAEEMIEELKLIRNKARQEQITKELLDIVGGVEGMSA
jgi:F-type H+-transporting ATPase subunit gamma